jgi:molybdopterin-guanine dinucleotide biosynthesis protein A
VDDLTAFVLAGGKSTRRGSDKAFLDFRGRTLLDRALEIARTLTPEVLVVGERSRFNGKASVVEDVFRDRGPLGGIHAALSVTATELNLVLAVDLPFVSSGLLQYLVQRARSSSALAVVPASDEGWQPLCAVYRRAFLGHAERALLQGKNKIDPLFQTIEVLPIREPELSQQGFSANTFRNLNTPADLEQARGLRLPVSQKGAKLE